MISGCPEKQRRQYPMPQGRLGAPGISKSLLQRKAHLISADEINQGELIGNANISDSLGCSQLPARAIHLSICWSRGNRDSTSLHGLCFIFPLYLFFYHTRVPAAVSFLSFHSSQPLIPMSFLSPRPTTPMLPFRKQQAYQPNKA